MGVSPLTIQIAFACSYSEDPAVNLMPGTLECEPGRQAVAWMVENGLLTDSYAKKPTTKLRAWVAFICATPLPVQEWRLPARDGAGPYRSESHG